MEHVVFFPAHDGSPAFRRVANLQDAVRLVEHLRNVEGVNEVSVHALAEVPLAFKPYYKVEVPAEPRTRPRPPRPPPPSRRPPSPPASSRSRCRRPIALAQPAPSVVPALAVHDCRADAPGVAVPGRGRGRRGGPAGQGGGAASLGFFAS